MRISKNISTIVSTIIIGVFICVLGKPLAIHAVISGNDSCMAFQQGCSTGPGIKALSAEFKSIGQLIAEGAGYYFNSLSAYANLLNKIEMTEINGLNSQEIKSILILSIDEMEKAEASYRDLWNASVGLDYNTDIIQKLKTFNYASFQADKGLNAEIFRKVEKLLVIGDVKGVYKQFYADTFQLSEMLQYLKPMAETCVFNTGYLWKINQTYSDTLLFGQYIAQVFNAIKK